MHVRSIAGVVAGALVLAACSDSLPTRPDSPTLSLNKAGKITGPKKYIIVAADSEALPQGLVSVVASNGGTVSSVSPGVGLAFVSASGPDFASKVERTKGVLAVIPDVRVKLIPPARVQGLIAEQDAPDAAATALTETFQAAQWNLVAVHAQDAWSTGDMGQGASVYIIDSGIDCTHPDLAPNVNVSLSVSFVPGETGCVTPGFYFNHGTHVAGIVGAALNGYGVVGVAPAAELVAVKVIPEMSESGSFGAVIQGIMYAADNGADIINMSLGTPPLPRRGFVDDEGNVVTARDVAELVRAVSRATSYAHRKGSTIIVAAGNEAANRDHDQSVVIPADLPNVLSIAATGPVGWVVNPGSDLNVPASYTNFGKSRIDFAAPGGNDIYLAQNPTDGCNAFGQLVPCGVLDFVFSTIAGGWGWAEGTSMAAPHASAVAALIVGKYGHVKPARMEKLLRDAAVDMGQRGKDAYFGSGFLDAARAVE
jgi:subtilisin family serine protease